MLTARLIGCLTIDGLMAMRDDGDDGMHHACIRNMRLLFYVSSPVVHAQTALQDLSTGAMQRCSNAEVRNPPDIRQITEPECFWPKFYRVSPYKIMSVHELALSIFHPQYTSSHSSLSSPSLPGPRSAR